MDKLGYWQERELKAQQKMTSRSIKETEEQLARYYAKSMESVIEDFENLYNKLRVDAAAGIHPTPADLYKLDGYWKIQGQLQRELMKLGDKQAVLFGEKFTNHWLQIYEGLGSFDDFTFSEANIEQAKQMINSVWCADGKSWSQRIWGNTNNLQQALNDNLIECVLTGKDTKQLKKMLEYQFEVSYHSADTIVRTEMLHIQTQAAQQRYKDGGVKEVEVWADKDERRCDVCGKLHQKRFPINGAMPIPAHPNCRCRIIPVIEPKGEQLKIKDF